MGYVEAGSSGGAVQREVLGSIPARRTGGTSQVFIWANRHCGQAHHAPAPQGGTPVKYRIIHREYGRMWRWYVMGEEGMHIFYAADFKTRADARRWIAAQKRKDVK